MKMKNIILAESRTESAAKENKGEAEMNVETEVGIVTVKAKYMKPKPGRQPWATIRITYKLDNKRISRDNLYKVIYAK